MNEQAELLFTEIWLRTNTRFSDVFSFRRLTRFTLPQATRFTMTEYGNFARSIASDEQYDKFFINKEGFFNVIGGVDTLASLLAQKQIESYQAAIDGASIVLAHSALDAAAFDYFRVLEIVAPICDLEGFVIKKQISLEELKGNSYDAMARAKIKQFIDDLERKSLLEKIDKMFQICQPPPKFSPINDYTFDRDKTESLDTLRHEIVHGTRLYSSLTNIDEDIKYMRDTANFLMALVNYKYNVKINPTVWKESIQKKEHK